MELEDSKYYSFGNPREAYRGDFLKWFKDDYYKNPPTQEQLDKLWDGWESKRNANRIILNETMRLRVFDEYILLYDIINPRIHGIFYFPTKRYTKRFLSHFGQEMAGLVKEVGELGI